jgi:hypothetical protein
MALIAATLLFGGLSVRGVEAGTAIEVAIDCDPSTGAIDASCVYPSGTTTVTANVVVTNNSSATSIGTVNFVVVASNVATLFPVDENAASDKHDANPDLNDEGFAAFNNLSCTPPDPDNDLGTDGDPTTAESFLSCFTGAANGPALAGGASMVIASVTYTVGADGVADLALRDVALSDNAFTEIASCNPEIDTPTQCFGATVQVGASSDTPTPPPAATDTPVPTLTPTPCVGAGCPTGTSLAFKSVTPTPSATTEAAPTTPPGEQPPAPPPPTGGAPGGGAGPGGAPGGTIRLPDTGTGAADGSTWTMFLGMTALALGAGAIVGGLWFGAASAANGRREGGD